MTTTQEGLIRSAMRLCTEIGLQTYGRRPDEMTALDAGQKLRRAETLARDVRDMLGKVLA